MPHCLRCCCWPACSLLLPPPPHTRSHVTGSKPAAGSATPQGRFFLGKSGWSPMLALGRLAPPPGGASLRRGLSPALANLAATFIHFIRSLGRARPSQHLEYMTSSAVGNLTPRAGELRSAPSGPDDRYRVAGWRGLALGWVAGRQVGGRKHLEHLECSR